MKKIISLLAVAAISMSALSAMTISAKPVQETIVTEAAQPRYAYTATVSSTLTISGTTAYCTSKATGMSKTSTVEGTQYLEKKTLLWWDPVAEWSATSTSNSLNMNNTKSGLSSGTYRLRTVFTVYSGNNSEEVEKISSEKII